MEYLLMLVIIIILGLINLSLVVRLAIDKQFHALVATFIAFVIILYPFMIIHLFDGGPLSEIDASLRNAALSIMIPYVILSLALYFFLKKE